MFLASTSGSDPAESDPALLAFVKCHITSLAKWEVLRVLASQNDWIPSDELVHRTHRHVREVIQALIELSSDGLVESLAAATPNEQIRYRLTVDEPTSVVLKRLIDAATHSQELRAIIAAQLQHLRQHAQEDLRAATAAA